jgi:hypothetical protein
VPSSRSANLPTLTLFTIEQRSLVSGEPASALYACTVSASWSRFGIRHSAVCLRGEGGGCGRSIDP